MCRSGRSPSSTPSFAATCPCQQALEQLPLHHRDPFDRLLVAQAIGGPFTLLSADAAFAAYGGPLQDARA